MALTPENMSDLLAVAIAGTSFIAGWLWCDSKRKSQMQDRIIELAAEKAKLMALLVAAEGDGWSESFPTELLKDLATNSDITVHFSKPESGMTKVVLEEKGRRA